jgi:hypothetical protein
LCHICPQHHRNENAGGRACSLSVSRLVTALLGTGRQNMTNYRSAVGAQQPSRVVLHGISISYSDSGGSGPVVICLHAIGHGARDFEDLSCRLSPSRWTFPTMEIRGQIPSPPAARATRGSWRNSSMSCISQRLCCWALHRRSRFHASLYPEGVKAIVLCDCGGLGPPVPSDGSLSAGSCNSSLQAGAAPSGFRGLLLATTEKFY